MILQTADPVFQHVGLFGLFVGGCGVVAGYLLEYRTRYEYPILYPMVFALTGLAFALGSVPQLAPRFAGSAAITLLGYGVGCVSLTAFFCYLIWRWPVDHPDAIRSR